MSDDLKVRRTASRYRHNGSDLQSRARAIVRAGRVPDELWDALDAKIDKLIEEREAVFNSYEKFEH